MGQQLEACQKLVSPNYIGQGRVPRQSHKCNVIISGLGSPATRAGLFPGLLRLETVTLVIWKGLGPLSIAAKEGTRWDQALEYTPGGVEYQLI